MITLPYTLAGIVIHGFQKAGSLGYPTANLAIDPQSDLSHGVYLGYSTIKEGEKNLPSIIFYGIPYTLDESVPPKFEVHILGRKELDLYDTRVEVTCEKFLRCNKKFASHTELQKAILQDLTEAKKYFSIKK
ncbi:riboflavin kinase [Candidatus Uhrbacteria bacterium]|nr:riboflavin kinase [Candidatus Uhrbacteria bacterium]